MAKYLLSRLAYECTKDSITMPFNTELGYSNFCDPQYMKTNDDWAMQAKKVFPSINTAFARLTQYNKIPYFTVEVEVQKDTNNNYYVVLPEDCDVVSAIYFQANGLTKQYSWKQKIVGEEMRAYFEVGYVKADTILSIEYRKEIPDFDYDDLVKVYDVGDINEDGETVTEYVDNNIDLAKYGVDKRIFQFIKLYVKGEIQSEIDPTQGNVIIAKAENYMGDMETYKPTFRADKIQRVF